MPQNRFFQNVTNLWTLTAAGLSLVAVQAAFAQDASVKVDKIPTSEDTSIVIRKGAPANLSDKPSFEVVSGSDEISSDEEFDEKKALLGWKAACDEWKKDIRAPSPSKEVIAVSCGTKKKVKEGGRTTYVSTGTYKMRVRIRD